MFVEAFGEIARCVESNHPADLVDPVFAARYKFTGFLQPFYSYEIVGCHTCMMLDIPEKECAADIHFLGDIFD